MNKIRCLRCDRKFPCTAKLPLLCGCGHRHFDQSELQQVDAPPGLTQKVMTATTAYTRWIQAGRPIRDAVEVARIHSTICRLCPLLKNDVCGACGCSCTGSVSITNKIAMATEHCPLDPPKW
jgi:hypothetical protein